jgi:hypothetical protein
MSPWTGGFRRSGGRARGRGRRGEFASVDDAIALDKHKRGVRSINLWPTRFSSRLSVAANQKRETGVETVCRRFSI